MKTLFCHFYQTIFFRVDSKKINFKVHSMQLQFLNYARQEKEKAISECQLRYQALVKCAAGMRSNNNNGNAGNYGDSGQQCSSSTVGNFTNFDDTTTSVSLGAEMMDREQGQNGKNTRRLYFSTGIKVFS